jgi:hypothetical protein
MMGRREALKSVRAAALRGFTGRKLSCPGSGNQNLGLKGAKMPAIMQHAYRCEAIHRGRAPRWSCSRTLEVETDTSRESGRALTK